ncbi:hypothetical protein ABEB36_014648 [Hypothenemus hampei]|uniref:Uncharacterized protein n=1 Tax=Hypothenemus hampei TaxID=57062 RepID=A0ABD1E2F0_HYPHA
MDKFKKCLYSQSYEEYEEQKKEFLEICKSVQVIVGTKDKYASLEEQLVKNWDSCKEIENALIASMDTDDVTGDIDDLIEDQTFVDDFDCSNKILSDREKFNTALTITKNIADILSNYGTQTFNKYVEELKVIENNARNGISLFTLKNSGLSAVEPEEQIQSNNESCSNESNKNLKFKTKIKTKGRPKRKTKQTTFYKKKD